MKRLLTRGIALAATLAIGSTLHAAPPDNDNLANAQVLTGAVGTVSANNEEATYESLESDYGCNHGSQHTLWYKWTAPKTESVTFDTRGSDFDTRLAAFTGTGYENFVEVAENDDYNDSTSRIKFNATAGVTYYIMLGGYKESCGDAELTWLQGDSFLIKRKDGEATGYVGTLPKTLTADDFPSDVTSIGDFAFEECDLVSVTFPERIKKIGSHAFAYCYDLETVAFEGDATAVEVSDYAFVDTPYGTTLPFRLIIEPNISTNVEWNAQTEEEYTNTVEYTALVGFVGTCPAELVIPEGVTTISDEAFSFLGNENLAKVTFPTTLKNFTFTRWYNYDSHWYRESWERMGIESYAFDGCYALAEVENLPDADTVSPYAFVGSQFEAVRPFELAYDDYYDSYYDEVKGMWVDTITTNGMVVGFHGTCPAEVTIPEGVVYVREFAFSLSSSSHSRLGDWRSLVNLEKVTLPSTIKRIGYWAFSCLPALTDVDWSYDPLDNDVSLEYGAFYGSPVFIPIVDSDKQLVEYRGNAAGIVIPEGVTSIKPYLFENCRWLESVTLPESLQTIGECAFQWCRNLREVTFLGNYASIGYCAFNGTPYENGGEDASAFSLETEYRTGYYWDGEKDVLTTNLWVTGWRGDEPPATINIPEGVYGIDYDALRSLENTTTVTIPASVKEIYSLAFAYSENLATVTFAGDKNKIYIDNDAFACTPYSAANEEFSLCYYTEENGYWDDWAQEWVATGGITLKTYGYTGTMPKSLNLVAYMDEEGADNLFIDGNTFLGATSLTSITLPAYFEYSDIPFGDCENLATVTGIPTSDKYWLTKTFQGTPFLDSVVPFELEVELTTNVVWASEVSYIDSNAPDTDDYRITNIYNTVVGFVGNLPDVLTFPANVDAIGGHAFSGAQVEEVVIPGNVKEIGEWAFDVCTDLEKLTLEEGVATIREGAFGYCTSLESVVIPDSVTLLGTEAFCGCYDLESVTIGAGVQAIGEYCFAECDALEGIVVPGNVKLVNSCAFEEDYNLETAEFEEGVNYLGDSLFRFCSDGLTVLIPYSSLYVEYYDGNGNFYDSYEGFYTEDLFGGIDGHVNVLAPRGSEERLWDRNILNNGCLTTLSVEFYTHVYLDPAGGALAGDAEYLSFGDVVTGLTTPTRDGYGLRAWVDEKGNRYENGDAWKRKQHEARLTALWGKLVEPAVDGVELVSGEPYGEENLVKLEEVVVEEQGRHGKNFLFWKDAAGNIVSADTIVGENDSLTPVWATFNPLADGEDAVESTAAQTYNGYLLTEDNDAVGTVVVKVGKPAKKTGLASVTATVQLLGEKKLTFKAAENKGKVALDKDGSTKDIELKSTKSNTPILLDYISEDGVFGSWGEYELVASRNVAKTQADKYANWIRTVEVVFNTKSAKGDGAKFASGYTTFQVAVAARGKVKVSGILTDGTKVTGTTQLLIAEDGKSACANVFCSSSKLRFGFVLWLNEDGTYNVESVTQLEYLNRKTPFTADLAVVDAAKMASPDGKLAFTLVDALPETLNNAPLLTAVDGQGILPDTVVVTAAGGRFTTPKAGSVKAKKGVLTIVGTGDNTCGLKVTYTAKTGQLKGSFTLYTYNGSKLKKVKANITGAVVGGTGYGTAVIKNVGSFAIKLCPNCIVQ